MTNLEQRVRDAREKGRIRVFMGNRAVVGGRTPCLDRLIALERAEACLIEAQGMAVKRKYANWTYPHVAHWTLALKAACEAIENAP